MGLFDWALVATAFWAATALIMSMVLEFKAGDQRIEWPSPDRVYRSSRYKGGLRKLYYAFVAWSLLGPVAGLVLVVLLFVRAIMERL